MKFIFLAMLFLQGCTGASGVMRALAKDPATACIWVTTIYGSVRVARTAAPNATVQCNQDGMTVRPGKAE